MPPQSIFLATSPAASLEQAARQVRQAVEVFTVADRLLAAIEALTGLLLVAWSASFTYLQMHGRLRGAFEEEGRKP